jgi:vesicular inhibitory amino acid transporter
MGEGRKLIMADDLKAAFSIFCCVYGIGTLGMPGNFSRAGPVIATIALVFMAFANVYAGWCITKVMLMAPKSVKTYGDMGEWCMGTTGRWLTVVAQISTCVLIPCVFLVLGGTLLDDLFPGAFSQSVWIILMALMVLPVCLIPTLKEGAGAAFAGCAGTVIADVIGVSVVMYGMRGHPSVPKPDLGFEQVAGAFGNLALAYGAGIIIPDVCRQHSVPTRMPAVVLAVLTVISCLFLTLAGTGYSAVGCQISGNLLYTIYPDTETGLSALGFAPDLGAVVLAFLFMQLHITIGFAVIINPAFYILERMLLGMHKKPVEDVENALSYADAATPAKDLEGETRTSKFSVVSMADTGVDITDAEKEAAEYRGVNAFKYVLLRFAIVVVLVVVAVLAKDKFGDFSDFIGASCNTANSIVLPIIFYYKKAWNKIKLAEKIPGIIVVVICTVLGCYVTYTSGKSLFTPSDSDISFPYCGPEYENTLYYNYTAIHG